MNTGKAKSVLESHRKEILSMPTERARKDFVISLLEKEFPKPDFRAAVALGGKFFSDVFESEGADKIIEALGCDYEAAILGDAKLQELLTYIYRFIKD